MLNCPAALTNVLVKPSVPLVVKVSFRSPISQKGQYPQYFSGCDSAYCNCRDGDNNVDYLECKEMVHLHHFNISILKRTIKDLLHECLQQLFTGLPCWWRLMLERLCQRVSRKQFYWFERLTSVETYSFIEASFVRDRSLIEKTAQ